MKLVDTNVFIYAVGRPHPYKEDCARLSKELIAGEHDANIDTELLQEVLFHFWQRRTPHQGFQLFDAVITGFSNPIPITFPECSVARDLMEAHAQLEPRDAIHAAVVLVHRLEGIISTDRAFDAIPGLTRFDPKDLA